MGFMFKKSLIALAILIIFFSQNQTAWAESGIFDVAQKSGILKDEFWGIELSDARTARLAGFLGQFNSPLEPYASCFVKTADKYKIDWKLLPAIAGVESTFGKFIPARSYNAYGWNNGEFWFKSWEDSIEKVSLALAEKYIARGLDTPYKIGPVYAPPSKTWAGKVVGFMKQIESFDPQESFNHLTL